MATVEEHIVKVVQQVTGASQANKAMQGIESRIAAEERALAGLEGKLSSANAKLAEMMNGGASGKSANLAAIEKQRAAIRALQDQIAGKKGDLETLNMGKGVAKMADDAAAKAKAEEKATKDKAAADRKAASDQKKAESEAKRVASEQAKRMSDAKRQSQEMQRAREAENAETIKALGPLGSIVEKLGSAAGASGAAVGAAIVLVTVLAAVTVGAIAATAALTQYAIAAADAARSQRLLDNAAAGSTARGSELNKIVSEVASNVPIAREQVAQFARQLQVLGVNGKRLQDAVTAIAMIESVIPGAGAKVEGLIERFQRLRRATLNKADLEGTGLALADVANQVAKMTGMSVSAAKAALQAGTIATDKVIEAMRKAIEQKFGKTIAAQMMSLTVQFQKLKENIQGLFSGLDLEPFLAALKSVTDLFSQNTATGRVLKQTMTLIFQPIINNIAKVAPLIRSFLIGFATGVLQVYAALKPMAAELDKAFGGVDKAQGMNSAFEAGRVIAHSLGVAVRLLIQGLTLLGKYLQHVQQQAEQTNGSLVKFGDSSVDVTTAMQAAVGATGNQAGMGVGDGMVAGMAAKMGEVSAMAAQMGAVVENALRNALGWHSPATLGIDAMGGVADGMQVGADKAEGKADAAVSKVIDPKAAKSSAKAGKGGGKWIYIENFYGSRENLTELRAFFIGEAEFLGGT